MNCKSCGLEMFIKDTHTEVEGDKSTDTDTKVYYVPRFFCNNPQCTQKGKLVDGEKILIYDESTT